jgi:A118 family predicted phage portal protein
MFNKILQWIREQINKMINTSNVKDALNIDVALSAEMTTALQSWSNAYINQGEWLANDNNIKSMNLPVSIASEIARMITIEMKVNFESDSMRAEYLQKQFDKVLFGLRQKIEFGCAKGGLMIKPYVNGEYICIDFVQADQFYPVSFDENGNITACVFSDTKTIGRKYYTRLEYHQMQGDKCVIKNSAFKSDTISTLGQSVPLTDVDAWAGLLPEATVLNIERPLYAYFRYPIANNIDVTSPLGISCYSRAMKQIEEADRLYSNLCWEFESGERAIYVDELAFGKDANGKSVLPNKRLYRKLSQGGQLSDEEMFHEWSPEFREASIQSGLNGILKKIEFLCGLAYGTISDPNEVDKTATEIVSSKQRTYATVTDGQKALQSALDNLFYAMNVYADLYSLSPVGTWSVVYDFDDSVVIDKKEQFAGDLQLVGSQIMSKIEWRMRNFKEDQKTAMEKLALVTSEQPQQDLFSTNAGV